MSYESQFIRMDLVLTYELPLALANGKNKNTNGFSQNISKIRLKPL